MVSSKCEGAGGDVGTTHIGREQNGQNFLINKQLRNGGTQPMGVVLNCGASMKK
jgi:hypothetical protein